MADRSLQPLAAVRRSRIGLSYAFWGRSSAPGWPSANEH